MSLKVRKVITGFFIILAVLVLLAVVVAAVFEDAIGEKIIGAANAQLKTELQVEDFDLSLLRSFPNASAELVGVTLTDTRQQPLLQAEKIAFQFGLFSLFKSKKQLKKVLIKDGILNILIDKQGQPNYTIWQSQEDKPADSDMSVALEEAQLINIKLLYKNVSTRQDASIDIEDAIFSGEFSARQFALESMAKLKTKYLSLSDTRYLVDKDLGYSAKVFVNLESEYYDFERMVIALDKNVFDVDGFIDGSKEGTDYNLAIHSQEGNIESVIQLLPEQYLKHLEDFRGRGRFYFEAKVEGRLSKRSNPRITAEMRLSDGRITSPQLGSDFRDVSLRATFTNGKLRRNSTSAFQIENFKGYFSRELIEMGLTVTNLDKPFINFRCNGAVPLHAIFGLFNNPAIKDAAGEIEINDLRLEGRYNDMLRNYSMRRVKMSGTLELDDVAFSIHKEELLFDRGRLELNDNIVTIADLKIEGSGSEIYLDGKFENLLPVLFSDSLNTKDAHLVFDSKLNAPQMDLDRLVNLTKVPRQTKEKVSAAVYDSLQVDHSQQREQIVNMLKGTFEATIENFNYNKIEGEDFKGTFKFENKELQIAGSAEGMEGYFEVDGKMVFRGEPYLSARLSCNEINIQDFFEQSENFGQTVVTADNLTGSTTARFLIDAYWDEYGNFLDDKLHVRAGLSIENGELKNVDFLESFSDYIHLEDLQHIKFVDMANWLEVKNRSVYIPVMFIRSNATNLTVSGTHTFDQQIDYNFKINAGQVLVNFLRPHNPSLQPQPTQRHGWFNMYFNLKGTIEDYNITTNKRKVKSAFDQSERRKRNVQIALNEAFGKVELLEEPMLWKDEDTTEAHGTTIDPEYGDEYLDGF